MAELHHLTGHNPKKRIPDDQLAAYILELRAAQADSSDKVTFLSERVMKLTDAVNTQGKVIKQIVEGLRR